MISDSADTTTRYMQFHPLAYIVKLKIEMSMADLIAKVAKQKEPFPTIRTKDTSFQTPDFGSRFGHWSLSRGKDKIQPLPPIRQAVNFRQWSTATSDAMPSFISPGPGTARNSAEVMRSPDTSTWDSSTRDLYMLQEVVVQTEIADISDTDGGRPEEAIQNRLVDDPATRQAVPTGGIWDGSASLSTSVCTG